MATGPGPFVFFLNMICELSCCCIIRGLFNVAEKCSILVKFSLWKFVYLEVIMYY